MRIHPFRALRPDPAVAGRVASLPYDVVSTEEARELADDNPLSLLHVVRAEIDFPAGTDPYADAVYARAAENFRRLQDDGHLLREDDNSLYIYQQEMGAHRQRGVVALCGVGDYEAGRIKIHERTRPEKEDDRTRLTSELSANPGPVFLTYRGRAELDALVDTAAAGEPLYDFTAEDGIRHTVWRVSTAATAALTEAFAAVPCFYVADGHHRTASAARVGRSRREANPSHSGDEDYNAFLSVLFPASQLRILPYNRLVADLNDLDPAAFLEKLAAAGEVSALDDVIAAPGGEGEDESAGQPAARGEVRVYLDGRWHRIRLSPPAAGAGPVDRLDVSLLQERVLGPVLGVDDPRTSDRIAFVGGIRGTGYLRREVDSGAAAVAFSLFPVSLDELMAISDAGEIMAPKCTWFEPKLRSGLLVHTFEPAGEPATAAAP